MSKSWKIGDFCVSINGLVGYIQAIAKIGDKTMYEIDYGYFVAYSEVENLVRAYDEDFAIYLDQQLEIELEQKAYLFKTCDVRFEEGGVSIIGDPMSLDDALDVAHLIMSKVGR